ncbi:hypothetical protein [Rhodopirellula sp. MGV]|uniref:hypothetical protein n=1 Tax=Rhodopirellula sp. MGV TaxID=2023130 RepID=UPI000B966909|nr:hypothetical protein [Rhodopirellula sp. MGV]OYP33879.1 hypothetical protein CGZ80_16945 [Rhodopirellula sp. MGV]PNY37300.1 pectate lyase [Rhodopirellula baltica]
MIRFLTIGVLIAAVGVIAFLQHKTPSPPLPNLDDAHRDLSESLAIFPGAEGFGTDTIAGRGGRVFVVETLADTGSGSLREALNAKGPRTIVFSVGGVIEAATNFVIADPFVTIAGQCAPAPGITLSGAGLSIRTHDVLVQHLAIRIGDGPGHKPEDRDAIQVIGSEDGETSVFNIVIDHVSMSWAIDEGFSTWYRGVRDVTVSHCLIAEQLDNSLHPKGRHSKAVLIGDHSRRISLIRNVFAHSDDRNPTIKGDTSSLVVNNLVYNPGRWPVGYFDPEGSGPLASTLWDNQFIYGPSSQNEHAVVIVENNIAAGSQLHHSGNLGPHNDLLDIRSNVSPLVTSAPVTVKPLKRLDATVLENELLSNVGSRPNDRDANDRRIIQTITERRGTIIDSVAEVGFAKPTSSSTRLTLPPEPNSDDDGDGYSNLEAWLHSAAAQLESPPE